MAHRNGTIWTTLRGSSAAIYQAELLSLIEQHHQRLGIAPDPRCLFNIWRPSRRVGRESCTRPTLEERMTAAQLDIMYALAWCKDVDGRTGHLLVKVRGTIQELYGIDKRDFNEWFKNRGVRRSRKTDCRSADTQLPGAASTANVQNMQAPPPPPSALPWPRASASSPTPTTPTTPTATCPTQLIAHTHRSPAEASMVSEPSAPAPSLVPPPEHKCVMAGHFCIRVPASSHPSVGRGAPPFPPPAAALSDEAQGKRQLQFKLQQQQQQQQQQLQQQQQQKHQQQHQRQHQQRKQHHQQATDPGRAAATYPASLAAQAINGMLQDAPAGPAQACGQSASSPYSVLQSPWYPREPAPIIPRQGTDQFQQAPPVSPLYGLGCPARPCLEAEGRAAPPGRPSRLDVQISHSGYRAAGSALPGTNGLQLGPAPEGVTAMQTHPDFEGASSRELRLMDLVLTLLGGASGAAAEQQAHHWDALPLVSGGGRDGDCNESPSASWRHDHGSFSNPGPNSIGLNPASPRAPAPPAEPPLAASQPAAGPCLPGTPDGGSPLTPPQEGALPPTAPLGGAVDYCLMWKASEQKALQEAYGWLCALPGPVGPAVPGFVPGPSWSWAHGQALATLAEPEPRGGLGACCAGAGLAGRAAGGTAGDQVAMMSVSVGLGASSIGRLWCDETSSDQAFDTWCHLLQGVEGKGAVQGVQEGQWGQQGQQERHWGQRGLQEGQWGQQGQQEVQQGQQEGQQGQLGQDGQQGQLGQDGQDGQQGQQGRGLGLGAGLGAPPVGAEVCELVSLMSIQ